LLSAKKHIDVRHLNLEIFPGVAQAFADHRFELWLSHTPCAACLPKVALETRTLVVSKAVGEQAQLP
jgi:hypothetical protein